MSGLLIGLAVIAAVVAFGWKQFQERRAERDRPGGSFESAIPAPRFDRIDSAVRAQRCRCGGPLQAVGESSSTDGDRRFRIVRTECGECGREFRVHFDVTQAFH